MGCFHCGEEIDNELVEFDEKKFCCLGCKTVYEILTNNKLDNFYALNQTPGVRPDTSFNRQFSFLDSPEIFQKITQFSDEEMAVVQFHIPVIHCASCVWLLEDLNSLNQNITQSTVNFTKKTVQITFNYHELPLSKLAEFLTKFGYKPSINLNSLNPNPEKANRKLLYQLVIAGFCFGNIMLLAFPEYTNQNDPWLLQNRNFFRFTMFVLSLPVFFYSAQDYFLSAWQGLKNKFINIDVPVALGIIALMLRSVYDVVLDLSPGYFDSLAGLVFFMLIGKWFQQKTYQSLAFDRDYQSFYPIAITKIDKHKESIVLLKELNVGDRILIRNEEMIPADCILMSGDARIDNSFITGETRAVSKNIGDKIFAGGKQIGTSIELEVIKSVNQSYLTNLWNNTAFQKQEVGFNQLINKVSQWFTICILAIAIIASAFWFWYDSSQVILIFTAILIVACPCALSLSAPFIFGNMMRIFGKKQFYLKNTSVVEQLSKIQHIVFDKTGTITKNDSANISYKGKDLAEKEKLQIAALCKNSNHPLSKQIYEFLKVKEAPFLYDFIEEKGKGISGKIGSDLIRLGSAKFVDVPLELQTQETQVFVKINDEFLGKFSFANQYRKGLKDVLKRLDSYQFSVISGDNSAEVETLKNIFPSGSELKFNQSPENKLEFIKSLQNKDFQVLMLGDGLNDAGALKQSNVGVAVTENLNNFSPSSDAILDAKSFQLLPTFLKLSKQSYRMVWIAFGISFLYNVVGLGFAVSGLLEPVVAAILMPISSISVVLFATLSTRFLAWRGFKNHNL